MLAETFPYRTRTDQPSRVTRGFSPCVLAKNDRHFRVVMRYASCYALLPRFSQRKMAVTSMMVFFEAVRDENTARSVTKTSECRVRLPVRRNPSSLMDKYRLVHIGSREQDDSLTSTFLLTGFATS